MRAARHPGRRWGRLRTKITSRSHHAFFLCHVGQSACVIDLRLVGCCAIALFPVNLYRELIDNSKWDHWREGFAWLAWSLIGGLFPVWLTIIGLLLTKQSVRFAIFTDNGEFAIYSASYVAGTLYILFRDFQHQKSAFPSRSVLGLIFSLLLLASAAMFMVVCLLSVLGAQSHWELLTLLDRDALRVMSLIVFPIAMLLSFLVVVADNIRTMPDVSQIVEAQFIQLNSDFDDLP